MNHLSIYYSIQHARRQLRQICFDWLIDLIKILFHIKIYIRNSIFFVTVMSWVTPHHSLLDHLGTKQCLKYSFKNHFGKKNLKNNTSRRTSGKDTQKNIGFDGSVDVRSKYPRVTWPELHRRLQHCDLRNIPKREKKILKLSQHLRNGFKG